MTEIRTRQWTDESPFEWKRDRIKDCLTSVAGGEWGDDPDSDSEGQDIVVLRVADFCNGSVKQNDLTIRRIKDSKIQQRQVTSSSLLIEKSGGGENQWVGRVVYPGTLPFDAICSNFIAKLEVAPTKNPKYLHYHLSALYDSNVNRPHVRQTTGIQNLALYHYLGVNIALPPLAEQKRIAAYLDASCAAIDRAVETKRKQLETLDALRKSIIQKAVTQGLNPKVKMKDSGVDWLGPIPEHWTTKKLSGLFYYKKGSRAQEITQVYIAANEGPFPVYSGQTSNEGMMGSIDTYEFDFDSPVILATTVGAKAMTTRLVSGKLTLSQNCTLMIPWLKNLDIIYYEKAVTELFEQERRTISLIMQPSLRFKDLKKFKVPAPPLGEQKEIGLFIREITSKISDVETSITAQLTTLTAYRKSLIHECVTGKRRISEADVARAEAANQRK